jgi:hypothetical protein
LIVQVFARSSREAFGSTQLWLGTGIEQARPSRHRGDGRARTTAKGCQAATARPHRQVANVAV